jgi:hypothetical protein
MFSFSSNKGKPTKSEPSYRALPLEFNFESDRQMKQREMDDRNKRMHNLEVKNE